MFAKITIIIDNSKYFRKFLLPLVAAVQLDFKNGGASNCAAIDIKHLFRRLLSCSWSVL